MAWYNFSGNIFSSDKDITEVLRIVENWKMIPCGCDYEKLCSY